ncbi:MAG: hypothetical protein ABI333_13985 [bacterium]
MAHLKLKTPRTTLRQTYTYLGCPLANRQPWCYRICKPTQGHGLCGRIAPHCHTGSTQRAIANYKPKSA